MDVFKILNSTLIHVLKGQISFDIDDTLLQKLLSNLEEDSLHSKSPYIRTLIKSTQVLENIVQVINDDGKDSVVISFSFQLLSLFLKDAEFDIFSEGYEFLLEGIRNVTQSPSWNTSASITVALFECLTAIVNSEKGYLWIQENDFITFGWRKLCGNSIFVQRSAETFLSRCFHAELVNNVQHKAITEKIYQTLNPAKIDEQYASTRNVIGCVNFMAAAVLPIADQKVQLPQPLNLFLVEVLKIYPLENETLDKISKLVLFTSIDESTCASILDGFLNHERVVSALKLYNNIINILPSGDPSRLEHHLGILGSPLRILTKDQRSNGDRLPHHLLAALNKAFQDRNTCRKIVSASIACLTNCAVHIHKRFKMDVLEMSTKLIEMITSTVSPEPPALHLRNCQKILLSLLNLQMKLIEDPVQDLVFIANDFLKVHVALLQDVSLSSVVFQSSSRIMGILVPLGWARDTSIQVEASCSESTAVLGNCLKRRLLDRHWEVVDSVLELMATLLTNTKVCQSLYSWVLTHDLHLLLWDMLANHDAEGYVRAACIEAVTLLVIHDDLWLQLQLARNITTETLGNLLCHLLRIDPEAFTQRAAVNSLDRLLASHRLTLRGYPLVGETLLWAQMSCLDWQVKVTTLGIWKRHLQPSFLRDSEEEPQIETPVHGPPSLETPVDTLTSLYTSGCLPALACALSDCDRPVRLLAAQIALENWHKIQNLDCSSDPSDVSLPNMDIKESHENNCLEKTSVVNDRDEVMDAVLDTDMYDRIGAVIRPVAVDEEETLAQLTVRFKSWDDALSYLKKCNLGEIVEENSKSTDVYENNLCSLLEDILAAVDCKSKEEYQSIDCY